MPFVIFFCIANANLLQWYFAFFVNRSVNLQQTAGLKRAALEKLGIPQKPVRPLSPYFRFLAQVRPNLVKSNPNLKLPGILSFLLSACSDLNWIPHNLIIQIISELSKIAGAEWTKLPTQQKQQYEALYKKEVVDYTRALDQFKSSLTDEHKMKIKEAQMELKETKIKKGLKLVW